MVRILPTIKKPQPAVRWIAMLIEENLDFLPVQGETIVFTKMLFII